MQMTRSVFARGVAVVASAYALLVIVVAAAITPGYSHRRDYISELGASGTTYGELVSWAGFIPVGILIMVFLFVALPVTRVQGASRIGMLLFFGSQAFAYASSGFAPCDPGCPAEGSIAQDLHNLFGALTYPLAAIGLFLLSRATILATSARYGFVFAGAAWLAAFFLMLDPAWVSWHGLLQRIAEVILWLSILFVAFRMTPGNQGTTRAGDVPR